MGTQPGWRGSSPRHRAQGLTTSGIRPGRFHPLRVKTMERMRFNFGGSRPAVLAGLTGILLLGSVLIAPAPAQAQTQAKAPADSTQKSVVFPKTTEEKEKQ